MSRHKATMTDVARRAGVSVMTVSRVFNDPDSVSAETRKRIEAAAAAEAYVPDRIAASLKSRTSNVVAAIIPSLVNSLFATTLRGLSRRLTEAGFVLTVAESEYEPSREARLVRELLSLRPAALVFHETTHAEETRRFLPRQGVAVVETGDLVEDPIDAVVSFSNRAAAKLLASHLVGAGRRNIAFVTLPLERSQRARERWIGFNEALEEAGIGAGQGSLIEVDGGFRGGAAAFPAILARRPAFDAIFGAGDVFAAALAIEARMRGVRVPDDIAIASFDHHDIIDILDPPLTHLRIPRERIGSEAADIIIARSRGQEAPTRTDVGFEVIARGSTGAP